MFLLGVCPVKGQIQKNCTTCPATCIGRFFRGGCIPSCYNESRCQCPEGTVIDEDRNECVPPDECPESMTITDTHNHTYAHTHKHKHTHVYVCIHPYNNTYTHKVLHHLTIYLLKTNYFANCIIELKS